MHTRTALLASTLTLSLALTVAGSARADDDVTYAKKDGALKQATPSAPGAGKPAEETYDPDAYVPPKSVAYRGGVIPKTAHLETKPDVAFIATGMSILGSAYATSLIYGVSTCSAQMKCRPGSGWLYMPLVGPFITSAQSPTTGGQALAAFDGGVQVLGAALTLVGFVAPKRFVTWQSKTASLTLLPTLSAPIGQSGDGKLGSGAGLTLTLTHL